MPYPTYCKITIYYPREPISRLNRLMIDAFFEPIMCYNRLMGIYNWQQPDWPHFHYDLRHIEPLLFAIAETSGVVSGKLSHLSDALKSEVQIDLMIEEALKTSAIEGEMINPADVRSSIKNQLGLSELQRVYDKRAEGIVALMFSVRNSYQTPLTEALLFSWHTMLFAAADRANFNIGKWRTHAEAMQIVSGHVGKTIIHFEAPPSDKVPNEMSAFIDWFNHSAPTGKHPIHYAPIRAALAHLYFESIHPFEDGNGRIGRAIAEKALSQGFGYPVAFSLSDAIESRRKEYYNALKFSSRTNEVTHWLEYFVNIILLAINNMEQLVTFIIKKSAFFAKHQHELNERQLKIVKRMFDAGIKGFEGGMTTKKYISITGTSKATATRDLQDLSNKAILTPSGQGRSVRYHLNI